MEKLEEEYCEKHGWEKKKGLMVNTEMINDDYEKFFIPEENHGDFFEECWMWVEKESDDEGVYDDTEIVEHIEDFAGLSFEEWKKM